ncbi:MAG: DMT family transporter [Candidatus Baldrarchaeia archaeon]
MSKTKGVAALIATTVLWGTSFPAIKVVVSSISEYTYVWTRSLIALILLLPYVIYTRKNQGISRQSIRGGLLAGIAYAIGLWLQGWGTRYTTASNSAFITGLNAVFVHIYTAVVLRKYSIELSVSLLLAITGLYLLTAPAGGFGIGDALVLLGAIAWAAQVIIVDRFSETDPIVFTFFEMIPALAFFVPSMLVGGGMEGIDMTILMLIFYLSIMCSDGAFILQVYGQRFVSPAATAIIFLFEPVAAAIFAYIFLFEKLTVTQIIGAAMIVTSMGISSLYGGSFKEKETML